MHVFVCAKQPQKMESQQTKVKYLFSKALPSKQGSRAPTETFHLHENSSSGYNKRGNAGKL